MSIGPYEIVIILIVFLFAFDKKELPHVIRSFVRTIRKLRHSAEKTKEDLEKIIIDNNDLEG
ncbi:twin-arginine translocase TatA/TatE family subunit [bacterium]|nr:twin-arginine translocase TatA/TatE family subunit [bacterium]